MFDFRESSIPGCYEIQPRIFEDSRGRFVKVFHEHEFGARRLEVNFREEYYSVSIKGVLRGLHFQVPPMDHTKMVYCVSGCVLDAIVDLRIGSPAYGKFELVELSAAKANVMYLPIGVAHGFLTLSSQAVLVYKVSTVHSPEHDCGIMWDSVGIDWPEDAPVVSSRDCGFPKFSEFVSPFEYVR